MDISWFIVLGHVLKAGKPQSFNHEPHEEHEGKNSYGPVY